jgi:hypothetical protein
MFVVTDVFGILSPGADDLILFTEFTVVTQHLYI